MFDDKPNGEFFAKAIMVGIAIIFIAEIVGILEWKLYCIIFSQSEKDIEDFKSRCNFTTNQQIRPTNIKNGHLRPALRVSFTCVKFLLAGDP